MHKYFKDIYQAVRTIIIGMRITLGYGFARTVTWQYPDRPPTLQPRFRGFHVFQIDRCMGCEQCAKACPVDCIYIEKSGLRRIDKADGLVKGGAIVRFAIDYSKCMFCALCTSPCPQSCLHMGAVHDLSGYDRGSTLVEFTELAKAGLNTPLPLWMQKARVPQWVQQRREELLSQAQDRRALLVKSLAQQPIPTQPAGPAACGPAQETGRD